MYDIVLLTAKKLIATQPNNPYVNNAQKEDNILLDSLRKENLRVKKIAWTDDSFDPTNANYYLFRTTWDYIHNIPLFLQWIEKIAPLVKMINSYQLIIWNIDKHYLYDLEKKGVRVIETAYLEPTDNPASLQQIHRQKGWNSTVLKPAISAAAKNTFRIKNPEEMEKLENTYRQLIQGESLMLQPFQKSVVEKGEVSLMMIGNECTHGIRKIAKKGDFRVQDDFGGTLEEYIPTNQEIKLAKDTLNACPEKPTYARVDIVEDNEGRPAISELELIEPEMWFRYNKVSADKLAKNITLKF